MKMERSVNNRTKYFPLGLNEAVFYSPVLLSYSNTKCAPKSNSNIGFVTFTLFELI